MVLDFPVPELCIIDVKFAKSAGMCDYSSTILSMTDRRTECEEPTTSVAHALRVAGKQNEKFY